VFCGFLASSLGQGGELGAEERRVKGRSRSHSAQYAVCQTEELIAQVDFRAGLTCHGAQKLIHLLVLDELEGADPLRAEQLGDTNLPGLARGEGDVGAAERKVLG
jgi:hypothetical protein